MLAKPQGFPRKLGGCAGLDPRLRSAVSAGVGDGERGLRRGLRAPGVGVRPKWLLEYSPSNKRIRYFVSITYVRTGLWTAHKFCGGGGLSCSSVWIKTESGTNGLTFFVGIRQAGSEIIKFGIFRFFFIGVIVPAEEAPPDFFLERFFLGSIIPGTPFPPASWTRRACLTGSRPIRSADGRSFSRFRPEGSGRTRWRTARRTRARRTRTRARTTSLAWTGFVHNQRAVFKRLLVELLYRLRGVRRVGKLDKGEPPNPAGLPVEGNEDTRHRSRLGEMSLQFDFRRVIGEVTDEEPTRHQAVLAPLLNTLPELLRSPSFRWSHPERLFIRGLF